MTTHFIDILLEAGLYMGVLVAGVIALVSVGAMVVRREVER